MAVAARARRYAEAIAQMARDADSWDQWQRDLTALVAAVGYPGVKAVLESPRVPLASKQQMLSQQLGDASPLAINLAQLLVVKGRVDIIPDILTEFSRMYDTHRGIEHARVTTAVPLDQAEREALLQQLSIMTGKQVDITTEVDPSILGGVVVRMGDKLIDGSTRGRLEALRRRLAG